MWIDFEKFRTGPRTALTAVVGLVIVFMCKVTIGVSSEGFIDFSYCPFSPFIWNDFEKFRTGRPLLLLWCFHPRARQQDNDKTNVEPVHSYDAFHTRSDMSGVKGIIGMHRFNICLVVVLLLSCSGVKTPLGKPSPDWS